MSVTAASTGRFERQTVLVTGGGRGIGAATALRLAADGAAVVVGARTRHEIDDVVSRIRSAGGAASAFAADVAKEDDVVALFAHAIEEFGGLDAVFLNAGTATTSGLLENDFAEFTRVIDTNLKSVWLGIREAARTFTSPGGGSILVTSSAAGAGGAPVVGSYAASKAAVNSLVRSAAIELGPRGIRVNAIAPAATRTQMMDEWEQRTPGIIDFFVNKYPLRRIATPESVAAAAAFLLSAEATDITGAILPVDDGETA